MKAPQHQARCKSVDSVCGLHLDAVEALKRGETPYMFWAPQWLRLRNSLLKKGLRQGPFPGQ